MNTWILATLVTLLPAAARQDPKPGDPKPVDSVHDAAATPEEFRPLFNGRDLTGWVPVNTAPSTWTVQDELLHCSGKPTGELRTDRMYQNFVLEVEWRHLVPRGNAGIFVWADDITARGVPFHRSVEVQVLENAYGNTRSHTTHGDIFPIHGAKMTPINGRGGSRAFPTAERSNPSPEWNHYRITCNKGEISLAVNGELVTRGTGCSPSKGYICLESEGGVVDYRNLRIHELPDTPVAPEHVAQADRGYRSLYTGVDLSGWYSEETAHGKWKSRDWVLSYQTENDGKGNRLSTAESWDGAPGIGFVFDVRRSDKSGVATVHVLGAAIAIDPEDPDLAPHLGASWNRFEGMLDAEGRLTLAVNGERIEMDRVMDREASDGVTTAPRGRIVLAPEGPIDFANLFVRELR